MLYASFIDNLFKFYSLIYFYCLRYVCTYNISHERLSANNLNNTNIQKNEE